MLNPLLTNLLLHYSALTNFVHYRFGCAYLAQEVMQDVCIRLLEKPNLEANYPVALLKKMSFDIAIDFCRKEDTYRRLVDTRDELPEVESDAPNQFQMLAAKQSINGLVAAINEMPPKCKAVFIMHKIHEIPQAEVAMRLGISNKTVEKHMRIGMQICTRSLSSLR